MDNRLLICILVLLLAVSAISMQPHSLRAKNFRGPNANVKEMEDLRQKIAAAEKEGLTETAQELRNNLEKLQNSAFRREKPQLDEEFIREANNLRASNEKPGDGAQEKRKFIEEYMAGKNPEKLRERMEQLKAQARKK